MIFEFKPWKLDIDIDLTKQIYNDNDYSIDKNINKEFIENLSNEQLAFFKLLGIDLNKIDVDKKVYDISEDEEALSKKIYRMSINFLMKGKILSLPKFQKDLYSDKDVFGKEFPTTIKVISSKNEYLETYDIGIGMGIVFKHPCFHYDDDKFKSWNCGYVLGALLIMMDM